MKIDKLIELLDTEESAIIVNKKTIDSFFDELNSITWNYGTWKNPDPLPSGTVAVCRNGSTIYFINKENIKDIKFKKI